MDRLIKELEFLAAKPDVPTAEVVGAVMATAVRCREILSARMVGLQALATTAVHRGSVRGGVYAAKYIQGHFVYLCNQLIINNNL